MHYLTVLSMIGGLVLFLYGIQTLGDSLKRLSGSKMEAVLAGLTSSKWKACLLGIAVTAAIQSSGATTVMVVGFVGSELMSLSQGVGIILGANVGTTITAWILSLAGVSGDSVLLQLMKPENFSPIIGLIGIMMNMMGKKDKHREIGAILTSFAVLMIGMDLMSSSAAPLASDPAFTGLLTVFANPILGVAAGLIVTVVLQSSSASVGILQAVSMSGTLAWSSALPILMGENIGSAVTGVLSSIGASRAGRRAARIQLIFCVMKAAVFMLVFYILNAIFNFAFMDKAATPFTIALFHTIFNVVAVAAAMPLSDLLVRAAERTIPITAEEMERSETRKELRLLDTRFAVSPAFALGQARRAACAMAARSQEAVAAAASLIGNYDPQTAERVNALEMIVDEYEDALGTYLVKIAGMNYTRNDSHILTTLMHCVGDFERITDHALNVMQKARQMSEDDLTFSDKAKEELAVIESAVNEIVDLSVRSFTDMDLALARTVEPLEQVIDALNAEIGRRHIRRLRKGKCTIEAGLALADITTDIERIADHCSNIAVCLLQVSEDGYDTHQYLERVWNSDQPAFRELEQGYAAKFVLPRRKKDDLLADGAALPGEDGLDAAAAGSLTEDAERLAAEKAEKKARKKAEKKALKASEKEAKSQKKAAKAEKKAAEQAAEQTNVIPTDGDPVGAALTGEDASGSTYGGDQDP